MIRAIAFDFDGVLVESVDVKTGAFRRVFAGEAPETVERIVAYHLENGGVSRFEKFCVIYRDILRRALPVAEFRQLCEQFARLVVDAIVGAPWVEGAQGFLAAHTGHYTLFIVSGTPQAELREIVRCRGIEQLVARRGADALANAIDVADDQHLPGRLRQREKRARQRRQRVSQNRQRQQPLHAVRPAAGDVLEQRGGRFRRALDDAEVRRARAQRH